MKMNNYLLVFLFFISIQSHTQELEFANHWKQLLGNNRQEALRAINNNKVDDLERLVSERIISLENGNMNSDEEFINSFLKNRQYEYYLYAFWNKDFFFKNYTRSGFNNATRSLLKQIDINTVNTPTIRYAVNYLKAIVDRQKRNFSGYQKYIDGIPTLKNWQLCGVFENLNQSGLDIPYLPESMAVSTEDFNANSNGYINWYTPKNVGRESYQFMTNHSEYGAGVHYAQTFIKSEINQRVILRMGSSSAFKVWLNDVLIFENVKDVTTDLDAYNVELNLPKGTNRLLIKNAEGSNSTYLIARLTNTEGEVLSNISDKSEYNSYNTSRLEDFDIKILEHPVEAFFKEKLRKEPDNFLYLYALLSTYVRNGKYDDAKKITLPVYRSFPKSSLLRKELINAYTLEGDMSTVNNLKKNMILDDQDYYMSLLYQFQDNSKLSSLDIGELQKFLIKFSKATNYKVLKISSDLMYEFRKMDKTAIRNSLDKMIDATEDWVYMKRIYGNLYSTVLKDDNKSLEILESIHAKYFDDATINLLASKYEKLNQRDKVIELYKNVYNNFKSENFSIINLVNKLFAYQKYKDALFYIDKAIENYPYSFQALRLKGDILVQLDKPMEAVKFYRKSLSYDGGNSGLRKKIYDLTNTKDIIEELHIKDVYDFIASNRNTIISNNYGYNILLDDAIVVRYPEGGGKYRLTFVYEITAETGIERFKEYDLGLSGKYRFIKNEIVKKDKSIVPADRKGSSLVFKGLEIGDVIYIEYENIDIGTGRFYKDYVDYYQFDSFHPCLKSSYTILVPDNIDIYYEIANGKIESSKEKAGNYTKYTWTLENDPGINQEENYMPNSVDIVRYLHISTIKSWNKISHWYSDLVRSQKRVNDQVERAFQSIFPQGYSNHSEEERARKIYYYIMKNFNYSSVSFRQSGFIPQRPSKTISTKLGDCKDFSTLFITLAEKAGLKANLVLILTNDYGQKSILLPSQDFNHCIVKVMINGKEQYLELTDKNLPFKSLPTSLVNATALEIPNKINMGKSYNLFKLPETMSNPSVVERKAKIDFVDNRIELDVTTKMSGAVCSYYIGLFDNPNYDVIKKALHKDFKDNIGINLLIDTISGINTKRGLSNISYNTTIKLDNENKKIGTTTIFQLPILSVVYENSIINLQRRNFPIEYTQYESVNHYRTSYHITLPEGKKFVEVPKSVLFSFKSHKYAISYRLINDNELKVDVNADVTIGDNISVNEYNQFKNYVSNVIEAKQAFIGYK